MINLEIEKERRKDKKRIKSTFGIDTIIKPIGIDNMDTPSKCCYIFSAYWFVIHNQNNKRKAKNEIIKKEKHVIRKNKGLKTKRKMKE